MSRITQILLLLVGIVYISPGDAVPYPRPKRSTNDACTQSPSSGMCMAYFIHYYYNSTSDTCNKYVYGGCQASDNNFETGEECARACGGTIVDSDHRYAPVFPVIFEENPEDDDCDLSPETGPCEASNMRYFFDGSECETFIYGGCGGNKNNFETKEECIEKCGHKLSDYENEV